MIYLIRLLSLSLIAIFFSMAIQAEPWIAVKTGLHCQQCHSNPTGAGKRKPFARAWLQTNLLATTKPASHLSTQALSPYWDIGFDARLNATYAHQENQNSAAEKSSHSAFSIEAAQLYFDVRLLDDFLQLYLDHSIAPGDVRNREAWLLMPIGDQQQGYIKLGQFFLPYGWRLQDDETFNRRLTQMNFFSADQGLELGGLTQHWQWAAAISNGQAGAQDNETGKQLSLFGLYLQADWRLGSSININRHKISERQMLNIFFGFRLGPTATLLQWDWIEDSNDFTADRQQQIQFAELTIELSHSWFLKLSAENHTIDDNNNASDRRYGLQISQFLLPMIEWKSGVSQHRQEIDRQLDTLELFLSLHVYH